MDNISKMGFRRDSPYKSAKKLKIKSNLISMQDTEFPLILNPNGNKPVIALPDTGNYYFPNSSEVTETPIMKDGGIHIKESRKGLFTKKAKAKGKSVQEYANQIMNNPDNYSPTLVKQANFAKNSKKFKHQDGGVINPALYKLPPTEETKQVLPIINPDLYRLPATESMRDLYALPATEESPLILADKKLSKNLIKFKKGGVSKNTVPVYPEFAKQYANVEVETGENVLLPDGNLFQFEGDTHAEGGIPTNLPEGSQIFSENSKVPKQVAELIMGKKVNKKMSYAAMASKFPTEPYVKVLDDPNADQYAKESANVKLNNHNAKLQTIFSAQELEKLNNPETKKSTSRQSKYTFQDGGRSNYIYDPKKVQNLSQSYTDTFQQQGDGSLLAPDGKRWFRNANGSYIQTNSNILPEITVTGNQDSRELYGFTVDNNLKLENPYPLNQGVNQPSNYRGTDYNNLPFQPQSQVPSWLTNPQLEPDKVVPETISSVTAKSRGKGKTKIVPKQITPSYNPSQNYDEPVDPGTLLGQTTERGFEPTVTMVDNSTQVDTGDLDTTLPGENPEVKTTTKSRNWMDFIPGSKAAGTILDIGMALSDNLTVDEPNYRDNRKYPIFNRFVNFDDKEVGRTYAASAEAIQNSNVPESVKQAQLASLNSRLQEYQAKVDFANAQRYENKLAGDTNKLQSYMDRNIDQATQDLDVYRQKKARVNQLVDQFKAQRKSRVFNSLRNFAGYVEETNANNEFSENYKVSPWSGKIKYKGNSQDAFSDTELQMRQFAASGQNGIPLGNSGAVMYRTPEGRTIVIDKEGKITDIK